MHPAGSFNLCCIQVFSDVTEFFSREGSEAPTLTNVIPSMHFIDKHLATDAMNHDLDPAIRVAIGCAKRTINHYYDKSDESAAYRIAMSKFLHSLAQYAAYNLAHFHSP